MDDRQVMDHISELVSQEHALERRTEAGGEGLSDEEVAELHRIEESLDQCWDLLRQRRARRSAGLDPDDTKARSTSTVEGYQQ